jgi:hypothetical protein
MITVKITRGSDTQLAEEFIEGITTYARVSNPNAAVLQVLAEEPCLIVVLVDGEETFRSQIPAAQRKEFALPAVLAPSRLKTMALSGFRALLNFGAEGEKVERRYRVNDAAQNLPSAFTIEVRKGKYPGTLTGTFKYDLLSDVEFDRRFNGFISARAPEEPKPVFTRDARPVQAVLGSQSRCTGCGGEITDPVMGCDNPKCSTTGPDSLKKK